MLSKNSYARFDERPEYKAEPDSLRLLFLVEIIERLLHGLAKPLSEHAWIKSDEFLIISMNYILVMCHA